MTIDRVIMAFAGSLVLCGLVLSLFFSEYWLILVAAVGLNLIQASFTGFCPAVLLLKKMGVKVGPAFR